MDGGRLVIITGLSGAGRSEAMRAFEDMGYFCVDNLPPSLLPKFVELLQKTPDVRGAALVMDIRSGVFQGEAPLTAALGHECGTLQCQVLYLEADEETLVRRYKATRRPHPWEGEERLVMAIRREREALGELRGRADVVIDTSDLTPAQLRQRLRQLFGLEPEAGRFRARLLSFGFKHGLPKDADLVFDIRFLPNPYYVSDLRPLDGNDPRVRAFVLEDPLTQETLRRLVDLLHFLLPQYRQEGKPQVTVAIGCTGGRHRSVVLANRLAELLGQQGTAVLVEHRDLGAGA